MGWLDGRVAIVTGGGRGIGAGISQRFAAEGAAVVVNDLGAAEDGSGADTGPAAEIVSAITAAGGSAVANGGDISDAEVGEELVRTAVERFGRLDIVVNTAGILRDRMIFNMSEAEWDDVIRVHLRGHFSTLRPASVYWREQRNPDGHYRIINFSSTSGLHGNPGQPNYAAAKMGVVGLTYTCANSLGRYGVTANAIAPGASTRLTATVPEDRRRRPLDDTRSPDKVAPFITYLASAKSDPLTGQVFWVSGNEVALYNVPTRIGEIASDGPWDLDDLDRQVHGSFVPKLKADG